MNSDVVSISGNTTISTESGKRRRSKFQKQQKGISNRIAVTRAQVFQKLLGRQSKRIEVSSSSDNSTSSKASQKSLKKRSKSTVSESKNCPPAESSVVEIDARPETSISSEGDLKETPEKLFSQNVEPMEQELKLITTTDSVQDDDATAPTVSTPTDSGDMEAEASTKMGEFVDLSTEKSKGKSNGEKNTTAAESEEEEGDAVDPSQPTQNQKNKDASGSSEETKNSGDLTCPTDRKDENGSIFNGCTPGVGLWFRNALGIRAEKVEWDDDRQRDHL